MIKNKVDYKEYLHSDMGFYYALSRKERLLCCLLRDPCYFIAKYIRLLRAEEYHFNTKHRLRYMLALARKNALGNKLGFKIPRNTIGPGLTIYHHGQIIINEGVSVGARCSLHGGNCIGNNGKTQAVPVIGDGLDLGIGGKIIGDVTLGNDICVGANAVVTKSFREDGLTLVGIPANVLNRQ